MTAKVRMQNQEFDLPEDLIALDPKVAAEKGEEEAKKLRDSNLKRWLSQISPAATNATLSWTEEPGPNDTKVTVVRVTPQLGTKGAVIVDKLHELKPEVNQVIFLSWELTMLRVTGQLDLPRLLGYQQRINDVLEQESGDERIVGDVARRLRDAKAVPCPFAPLGF